MFIYQCSPWLTEYKGFALHFTFLNTPNQLNGLCQLPLEAVCSAIQKILFPHATEPGEVQVLLYLHYCMHYGGDR